MDLNIKLDYVGLWGRKEEEKRRNSKKEGRKKGREEGAKEGRKEGINEVWEREEASKWLGKEGRK